MPPSRALASLVAMTEFKTPRAVDFLLDGHATFEAIDEAIRRIGRPERIEGFRQAARCLAPQLALAKLLFETASGVVRGEPRASREFDEAIELLRASGARGESIAVKTADGERLHGPPGFIPAQSGFELLLAAALRDAARTSLRSLSTFDLAAGLICAFSPTAM